MGVNVPTYRLNDEAFILEPGRWYTQWLTMFRLLENPGPALHWYCIHFTTQVVIKQSSLPFIQTLLHCLGLCWSLLSEHWVMVSETGWAVLWVCFQICAGSYHMSSQYTMYGECFHNSTEETIFVHLFIIFPFLHVSEMPVIS